MINLKLKVINNAFAKQFMIENHYTKSCAKATISFGFYTEKEELSTVIVYGQPSGKYLASSIYDGCKESECLELLRLFSYDWNVKNTESYCIAKSIKYIKENMKEIKVLISYADTSAGHIGYIYQASNWLYIGKGSCERKIFIDGQRQHRRNLYDLYGTSSIPKLKEILGERLQISEEKFSKNKYIYITANKKEKKEIIKKLKTIPISEYPKGDLNYYDNNSNSFLGNMQFKEEEYQFDIFDFINESEVVQNDLWDNKFFK